VHGQDFQEDKRVHAEDAKQDQETNRAPNEDIKYCREEASSVAPNVEQAHSKNDRKQTQLKSDEKGDTNDVFKPEDSKTKPFHNLDLQFLTRNEPQKKQR
jgi:hypothetical protein